MSTVSVVYVGGSDVVHIPDAGAAAARGVPVDVPADIAGRPPGGWHVKTDADPAGWPTRMGADGSTVETFDSGEGLLAQVDIWQPAAAGTDTEG